MATTMRLREKSMGTYFPVVKPLQVSEALTMCAWYVVLQTEADLACMVWLLLGMGGLGIRPRVSPTISKHSPSELQPYSRY